MSKRLAIPHQSGFCVPRSQTGCIELSSRHPAQKFYIRRSIARHSRPASSQATFQENDAQHPQPGDASARSPLSQIAKQKQVDKEFFASLLSSAATKRDAKAYITRLKQPEKTKSPTAKTPTPRPQVNLGGLFRTARAVEQSPVFTQYEPEKKAFEEEEVLHVALVKLKDPEYIPDNVLVGVAETLCQLARLSMSPCVVLEVSGAENGELRQQLHIQAERLSVAIDAMSGGSARIVESVLSTSSSAGELGLSLRKLLMVPLRRGLIPIVLPLAYSESQQKVTSVSSDEALLALTRGLGALDIQRNQQQGHTIAKQASIDRIIVIDAAGGIPNPGSADGNHVFLNLEQEYHMVLEQLTKSSSPEKGHHLVTVKMLREALSHLPPSASGLIATPEEAANMSELSEDSSLASVGTRRQKNALIHNLLTDKPAYSSSLPKSRLSKSSETISRPSTLTFVKHGMSLKIFPDPASRPWTPDGPRVKLTDSHINLARLVYLVDDSFNRELDTENYLKRVNDKIAGVIIAGDYEGGAILTWETPPGADDNDTERLVPYLDKFAVLKRSQGAGGVADIVFNAMVRTCFPNGVCWRSRKNNPVNKWYFERSRGTKKIPDMNWTMFWTTPNVPEDSQKFQDYEGVCRGVEPTWLDKRMAAD